MRRYFLLLLLGWLAGGAQAQPDPLIINVDGRRTTSLHGSWAAIVDPFDVGYRTYRNTPDPNGFFRHRCPRHPADRIEYSFEDAPRLEVPGDWNSQRPELFFYEGTVWYQRTFTYRLPADRRLFLYFGAANYKAIVPSTVRCWAATKAALPRSILKSQSLSATAKMIWSST